MDFIEEANRLFGGEVRPAHFTDYRHCDECAQHDATRCESSPETLTFDQVRLGWDPLCFITPKGFRYYFPALVRLAINGTGPTYFVDQLIFHLECDGENNPRIEAISPPKKRSW